MSEIKSFAAFDVDGTIFKSSLLEKIVAEGIANGIFEPEPFNNALQNKRRWQRSNNEGLYQAYIHRLVKAFTEQIAGVSVDRFGEVTTTMLEENRDRMLGFPRKLIRELRATHYIVALSGSPELLVEPFLQELGFDAAFGTRFSVENEKFTGEFQPIGDKSKLLAEMVGRGVILQDNSVAIGDTVGDISMLDYAQQPIMFNASRTLTNYGREFGWPRVHEVKDQITVLEYDADVEGYKETDLGGFLAGLRQG